MSYFPILRYRLTIGFHPKNKRSTSSSTGRFPWLTHKIFFLSLTKVLLEDATNGYRSRFVNFIHQIKKSFVIFPHIARLHCILQDLAHSSPDVTRSRCLPLQVSTYRKLARNSAS